MPNTGYLGGNVSMAERYRLRDKYLKPLADRAVKFNWRGQCRCGSMEYVHWRGRWYCIRCARFVRNLSAALPIRGHRGFDCNNTEPYSSITKEPM